MEGKKNVWAEKHHKINIQTARASLRHKNKSQENQSICF